MIRFRLANALNRYFQVGCTTFTKHELLAYGDMNFSYVQNCLHVWESRGLLQVLKPLSEAEDGEIVVKLLHPIEYPKVDRKGPVSVHALPRPVMTKVENPADFGVHAP